MTEPTKTRTDAPAGGGLNWRSPRALLRYVLSLDDTPHHIALGAAIGMFLGLTPTVGVQMLLAIAVYYLCLPLFRFNLKAAVVTVYVSNPLTMLPIYWFDYRVGRFFFGGDVTKEQLAGILRYDGFAEWWSAIWILFVELGWTMLVGSLIVGAAGGLLTYPAMRWLLNLFRGPQPRERPAADPERVAVGAGR